MLRYVEEPWFETYAGFPLNTPDSVVEQVVREVRDCLPVDQLQRLHHLAGAVAVGVEGVPPAGFAVVLPSYSISQALALLKISGIP